MTDLSLIPLDDLIEAIEKRCDSMVFAYTQNLNGLEESCRFYWHGGNFTAIGLAERLINKIHLEMDTKEAEQDDPEA